MEKKTSASNLPIFERAVERFPHLIAVKDAKTFCQNLCRLEAVQSITPDEYWCIARVAEGGPWEPGTGNEASKS